MAIGIQKNIRIGNKLIKVDTNGSNAYKYKQNQELYDVIVPNILFLVDIDDEVYMATEFDWVKTRDYFSEDNNGHCIYFKNGYYISAAEILYICIKTTYVCDTLSELCDCLAKEYNIESWLNKK